MSKPTKDDPRPLQAIPGDGQETHDGHSGFIAPEKFARTGSLPYDHEAVLNSPTRTGLQKK